MKPTTKRNAATRLLTRLGLTLTLCLPMAACDLTDIFDLIRLGKGRVVVDTSCEAFEPITWSRSDTPETARQVVAHNASLAALCPGE